MARPEKDVPELVRAAQALEDDIARLEQLSRSVRKIPLDSDRSIGRAAKELNEALELPDRITGSLRSLIAAMEGMQGRQQAAIEPLAGAAANIQTRMLRLGEHMQAFAALGKAAGEATAMLQPQGDAPPPSLDDVDAHLGRIVEGARDLQGAARADDFPDVAREADALRQRIVALRGRLKTRS